MNKRHTFFVKFACEITKFTQHQLDEKENNPDLWPILEGPQQVGEHSCELHTHKNPIEQITSDPQVACWLVEEFKKFSDRIKQKLPS